MTIDLAKRQCIFCGQAGGLTKEHVNPRWIIRILNDRFPRADGESWGLHYSAGGMIERERQHVTSEPTVLVRAVCTSCNSGWMSELEGQVMPTIGPMIAGERVSLDVSQQLDIATWAAKTVAAFEAHEPTTTVLRQSDREIIWLEQRPPSHLRIRLAIRQDFIEAFVVKMRVARPEEVESDTPSVLACTMGFGHLLVQAWGGPGAESGPGIGMAGTAISNALMIWPPIPGTASWPPSVAITDETFDIFADEVLIMADDTPTLAAWRARRSS